MRAATQRRCEVWVGWPAVLAILSDRLLPGFGDRIAARNAYDAQHTSEAAKAGRPDNLFEPAAGPFGAHGRFDRRARATSVQWWLSTRRWEVAAVVALAGVAAAFTL